MKRKKNWELSPQERREKTGCYQPEIKQMKITLQDQLRWLQISMEELRKQNSRLRSEAYAYAYLKKQTVMILEEGQDPVVLRGGEMDVWVAKRLQSRLSGLSGRDAMAVFDEVTYDT